MNRKHAVSISLAVGLAALAGSVAATKTVGLSHPASAGTPTTSAIVASRAKALDRTEIALRKALAQQPPALPPLPPAIAPTTAPDGAGGPAAAPPAQRVIYVRPAPHIVTIHRAGENEHESEAEGSHDGAEGGFDD